MKKNSNFSNDFEVLIALCEHNKEFYRSSYFRERKKKIIENMHNGEIMLLHATSKTNMEILDEVIKQIKNMGYEFKSINEFIM